jgi:hypothetical protein
MKMDVHVLPVLNSGGEHEPSQRTSGGDPKGGKFLHNVDTVKREI